MNSQNKGSAVPQQFKVEVAFARVAVAAFTYYPEKSVEEPGYVVDEDVEWALEPIHEMDAADLGYWRERVRAVISDPTADRRAFLGDFMALAGA